MSNPSGPLQLGKEYPIPNEDRYVALMIEEMIGQLAHDYGPGDTPREFHPKEHALLKAEFIVEKDLAPDLRVGVFAEERSYDTYVRYSNGNHAVRPDIKKDVRGMALKLTDVPGFKLMNDGERTDIQDFIFASNECFFAKDVRDFQKSIQAVTTGPLAVLGFLLSNPIGHLGILGRSLKANIKAGNLLQIPYWSTTPYQFGDPSRAVKYHLRPVSSTQDPIPKKPTDWYLRDAIMRTLEAGDVWFDFLVQFQENAETMPIENATVPWSSPYIKLASLRIPKQKFATAKKLSKGQNMSFNPWHSLPEHRPLGGPNRARKAVYHALSAYRLSRNGLQEAPPR